MSFFFDDVVRSSEQGSAGEIIQASADAQAAAAYSGFFGAFAPVPPRWGNGNGRRMSWWASLLNTVLRGPADLVVAIADGKWERVGAGVLGFGVGFGVGWISGSLGLWAWTTSTTIKTAISNTILTVVGANIAGEVINQAIVEGKSDEFTAYYRAGASWGGWAGAASFGAYKAYNRLSPALDYLTPKHQAGVAVTLISPTSGARLLAPAATVRQVDDWFANLARWVIRNDATNRAGLGPVLMGGF